MSPLKIIDMNYRQAYTEFSLKEWLCFQLNSVFDGSEEMYQMTHRPLYENYKRFMVSLSGHLFCNGAGSHSFSRRVF